MNASRALVTGAAGFIGRAVCRELLAGGCHVAALCRRRDRRLPPEIEPIVCDLADRRQLLRAVESAACDCIFHFAGYTSATRDLQAVPETFDSNLAATVNVLFAATQVGCNRLVVAGSLEEPDPGEAPSSPYAASKLAGTHYARMFHQVYGTPVVIARIFMVYGPDQQDTRKLIPHTILRLLEGRELAFASGRRELDWIYIDDLARGLVELARRDGLAGEVLDFGTGTLTPIRRVVEMLIDLVDPAATPRFGVLPERKAEQIRQANARRTEERLGWRATVGLPDGLARTVRHYRERHPVPGP